jgi:succinate dehydrogenase/fumarate reductase cytochrome b subunit
MATAESRELSLDVTSLTGLAWLGIVAAVVSAAVHLLLGVRMLPSAMGVSFVLAGLGFLGAVALVLLDYRRRAVYAVGIPFTLVQILLWYYVNFVSLGKSFPADIGTLGAVDKVAQVVLLVVLVSLLR